MPAPVNLIQNVEFPADIDAIYDLCTGKFNSERHTCGGIITYSFPVVISRKSPREITTTFPLSDNQRELALAEGVNTKVVEGYDGLVEQVQVWLSEEFKEFFRKLTDGSFHHMNSRNKLDTLSPIILLAMKLMRDRFLQTLVVIDESSGGIVTQHDVLHTTDGMMIRLTAEHVEHLVRVAILDGKGAELEEAVRGGLPLQCVDPAVLAVLGQRSEGELEKIDDFVDHYIQLVACAIAHRISKCPNPTVGRLTEILILMFEFHERDDVVFDDRLWLSPEVFRSLIGVEQAMEAAEKFYRDGKTGLINERSHEFVARLGWPELSSELLQANFSRMLFQHRDLVNSDEFWAAWVDETLSTINSMQAASAEAQITDSSRFSRQWDAGRSVATTAYSLAQATLDSALELKIVRRVAERLEEVSDTSLMVGFYVHLMFLANKHGRTQIALDSAVSIHNRLHEPDMPQEFLANALIDVGNTFRYVQDWQLSLECYKEAEVLNESLSVEHDKRKYMIIRNRAIVLRDSGRYTEAELELQKYILKYPDDPGAQHSILMLYHQVGRLSEVVARSTLWLERSDIGPSDRYSFLLLRAVSSVRLGHHDQAGLDCIAAAAYLQPNDSRYLMIAAITLSVYSTLPEVIAFVTEQEDYVATQLEAAFKIQFWSALTAGVEAALRALRGGRLADANKIALVICGELDRANREYPWQLDFVLGWYLHESDMSGAFNVLVSAVHKLDQKLPLENEVEFTIGLLADTHIEELQRIAVRVGTIAVAAGEADADDLVSVLDVANARDLTARASVNAQISDAGEATLMALNAWQRRSSCDIISVVDDTDTVHLLIEPADSKRRLVDTGIKRCELQEAVAAVGRFELCMPQVPERQDRYLDPWWRFGQSFAEIVRRELPEDRELIILPGRLLAEAPLHAAGWPEAPLIDDRTVSIAPNHRLLVGQASQKAERSVATSPVCVVAIPKSNDTTNFVEALQTFVAQLQSDLPSISAVVGPNSDEAVVLQALSTADVALVLCHGVHGGPAFGPGICVAADEILPPPNLSLGSDPSLGAFVLTWDDLARIERSPDVVISIACSTARTSIGVGGSRLGLEHGLLANATRFSAAPLWSVAQLSALDWVNYLTHEIFTPSASLDVVQNILSDLPEAYRSSVLALKKLHPHPYHWAPYILSTSLRGGSE